MDVLEIIRRQPFRADAAQRRLPGVHMSVDEPRHHDLVGGVDNLVGAGAKVAAGSLDGVAAVKKLTTPDFADPGIKRHEPAALDENTFHECTFVAVSAQRYVVRSAKQAPAGTSRQYQGQ